MAYTMIASGETNNQNGNRRDALYEMHGDERRGRNVDGRVRRVVQQLISAFGAIACGP